ncbi:chemotaxis protein CheC [Methanolobus sp.]|jgi:chemotaxis protein CheC|uniref:chemotaxis protein CheC n=1 Tax=Methanolobus sp. TaxID=1874737 RepID=UPI0025D13A38|nr:chemotaxis protein CheC [Methanolobus sp.]
MEKELDNFIIDAFKEIGSIGMGNATTSLSKLIEKRVQLNLSDARLFEPSAIIDMIPESITMTGIMVPIHGDLNGLVMLMFEFGNAVYLSNMLLQGFEHNDNPNLYESALLETGNIIAGSYLNSLSSFLSMKILHSVPDISIGYIKDILDRGTAKMGNKTSKILNIETMFMVYSSEKDVGAGTIYGDMFLLLDEESLDKMQSSICNMLE